jgi:hypothetical protein
VSESIRPGRAKGLNRSALSHGKHEAGIFEIWLGFRADQPFICRQAGYLPKARDSLWCGGAWSVNLRASLPRNRTALFRSTHHAEHGLASARPRGIGHSDRRSPAVVMDANGSGQSLPPACRRAPHATKSAQDAKTPTIDSGEDHPMNSFVSAPRRRRHEWIFAAQKRLAVAAAGGDLDPGRDSHRGVSRQPPTGGITWPTPPQRQGRTRKVLNP